MDPCPKNTPSFSIMPWPSAGMCVSYSKNQETPLVNDREVLLDCQQNKIHFPLNTGNTLYSP